VAVWIIVDGASSSDDYLLVFVASGLYPFDQLVKAIALFIMLDGGEVEAFHQY
jgi:hypothetical protein